MASVCMNSYTERRKLVGVAFISDPPAFGLAKIRGPRLDNRRSRCARRRHYRPWRRRRYKRKRATLCGDKRANITLVPCRHPSPALTSSYVGTTAAHQAAFSARPTLASLQGLSRLRRRPAEAIGAPTRDQNDVGRFRVSISRSQSPQLRSIRSRMKPASWRFEARDRIFYALPSPFSGVTQLLKE